MKIGFIDYYLDEWHANNYPARLKELSGGEVEVAYAFAEIDHPNGGLTTDQWCEKNGIQRVNSIEELVALSDGIVVLSPDNCERHEQLCRIPLASGKPCYVDKTFAPTKAAAERIFANAEAHNTPCYSTSALRYAAEYADIDTDGIHAIAAWGPNGYETYSIHTLEPVITLMNARPKRVLGQTVSDKWYTLLIEFVDGRTATITGYADGAPFMMNIASDKGNKVVNVESDFFGGFLKELTRFFMTKQPTVPHQTTIDIMAVREAGMKALEKAGIWVEI